LKKTYERHFPDSEITSEEEYYNHLMHIATYQYALKFVKGKSVLDYGCGSGYGSYLLSGIAKKVTGVDVSDESIKYCRNSYSANNLFFRTVADLTDEKYDVITSFQVIEHVLNVDGFLEKIKKLLSRDGYLLISTPDLTNRLFKFIQKPWNVYHIKEYSSSGLYNLLNKYFTRVDLLKIGSKSDLVKKEIVRTKKQRIITLPCTLFFYPDFVRVFLLNLQVTLFNRIRAFKHSKGPIAKINFKEKYSIHDIEINKIIPLSTDLLAICSE
jgi:2-polyprenyl-3-methyl-5-hydroxy-6-metoxy-1,4-benzoquinol methylase